MPRRLSRSLLLLLPLVGACLGEDVVECAVDPATLTYATALGVNIPGSTLLPGGTRYRDLTVGTGEIVATGNAIEVRYVGWLANGTKIDETAAGGPGFQFQLGARQVIAGWDVGIPGMRVGGLRQLVIPPSEGYGRNTFGPIPGCSVLVFNVNVTAIITTE